MLEIKSISKSFKDNQVLHDISLSLGYGELIHIKGGNGSGKSTLLKLVAGLMKPDSGTISLSDGVKIGALIENPSFIENETIAFNLKFLYTLTQKYDEAKVVELVSDFLLDYNSRKAMKNYSIGMRQKAGIIQAIMEDQNLILLDEPTRGLDDDSMDVFNDIVSELISAGKSMIICAHDGVDSLNFDRRFELKNGKLYEINQV